jgi:hypothetical protein
MVQAPHAANVRVFKKVDNLRAALALHFAYYNFCRVVRTIMATPGDSSGAGNTQVDIGRIAGVGINTGKRYLS